MNDAQRPPAMATNRHGGPTSVLGAIGVSKRFLGVQALDDVSLTLQRGEIHALAGENGSGKSTLAKILYGALRPDRGHVQIDGTPVELPTPRRAAEHGIAAITQELTLAPTLSVAENIAMGHVPLRAGLRTVDWRQVRRISRAILDELGVHVDERKRVDELSIELQQEVEIARALARRPRVLIVDEATSALSEAAAERLLTRLGELREAGVAVLFISHRLRELYECADRATVLRDGRYVGTLTLSTTPEDELVHRMVGREIGDLYGKRTHRRPERLLDVTSLTTHDQQVRNVTFSLDRGEIVGVAGLVGCGKAELALALAGAVPASGEIQIDGARVNLKNPSSALRAGIAFVPDDRRRAALFPTLSVQRNLSVAWHSRIARGGTLRVNLERALARQLLQRFGVRLSALSAPIVHLSGGNQQKVILARCISTEPKVVVLCEPTRGIDVGAKADIYGLVQELAAGGAGIIMISSELPELLGVSDRILVMARGEIRAEFDRDEAAEDKIAHAAMGEAHVAG